MPKGLTDRPPYKFITRDGNERFFGDGREEEINPMEMQEAYARADIERLQARIEYLEKVLDLERAENRRLREEINQLQAALDFRAG